MRTVLLQDKFDEQILQLLLDEFAECLFLTTSMFGYKNLTLQDWESIEVLVGSHLSIEELHMAKNLHWIHALTPNIRGFCLDEIKKQEQVMMTVGKEEGISQIGEFAMASLLAFSKNLFSFKAINREAESIWSSDLRDSMWKVKGRDFLQIGLSSIGSEIAMRAHQMGMSVHGIEKKPSFHPYCNQIYPFEKLPSFIENYSIVCVTLQYIDDKARSLVLKSLNNIRKGSILIWLGDYLTPPLDRLADIAVIKELKGLIIDASYALGANHTAKIWSLDNCLVTPEVASRPLSENYKNLKEFRYNLRQYLYGNYQDMHDVIIAAE